jgi:hypothetical protein
LHFLEFWNQHSYTTHWWDVTTTQKAGGDNRDENSEANKTENKSELGTTTVPSEIALV